MTRSLHLRHVIGLGLGLAGFAVALGSASNATAQDGAAPAASAASTTPATSAAPAAAPATAEDDAKKKAEDDAKKKAEDDAKKKKDPAGGAASPGTTEGPTTSTAGPPTTSATPTGGENSTTVTFGTSPKKDEPSKGAAKPEATPPPPWYRGSLLIFDQSMTTNTFSKGAQLSYQPVYEWWISPRVNYNFSKELRLTVRQDLFKEFTNQGDTTERRELRYTDSWLSLSYRPPLTSISKNLSGALGLQFRPGISKESRIAGQIFSAGPVVSLNYNIELGGEKAKAFKSMHLSSAFIYTYAVSRCNTPCNEDFSQRRMNTEGQVLDDRAVRAVAMPGNQLVYTANVGLDIIEHLDFSASMIWISQFAKGTSDATFAGAELPRASDDTRLRQFSWFFSQFSYGVSKEFTVAAGYWNLNNVLSPTGGYRNPFWSPEARIFLDVYFHLDAIYEKLTGGDGKKGTGPAGGGSRVF